MKAFPSSNLEKVKYHHEGMDLIDYFATKALQGLMSRVDHVNGDCVTNASPDDVAGYAYGIADAMMKVRKMRKERE